MTTLLDLRRKTSIAYLVVGGIALVAVAVYFLVAGLPSSSRTIMVMALVPVLFVSLAVKKIERVLLGVLVVSLSFSARYRLWGGGFHTGGAELAIAPIDFPLLGLFLLALPDALRDSWRRALGWLRPISVGLLVFGAAHLVSIFVAPDHWLATLEFLRLIKMVVLVLLVAWYVRSRKDLRFVVQILLVTAIAQGALAAAQWATKGSFGLGFLGEHVFWTIGTGDATIGRSGGTMGHANALAHFFELVTPVALVYTLSYASGRAKLLGAVAVAAGLGGTFLTFSRGGWVAVALGLVLVLLIQVRRQFSTARAFQTVLAFALAVGLLALPFQSLIYVRLANFGGASVTFRVMTWKVALSIFSARPWLGVGANNYLVVVPDFVPVGIPLAWVREVTSIVHNFVLLYAAEMGITGIVALLALFASLAVLGWRLIRLEDTRLAALAAGISAGICALVLHGQLGWLFRYDPVFTLFWFFVGLLVAMYRLSGPKAKPGAVASNPAEDVSNA